jgi:hypothetical protein
MKKSTHPVIDSGSPAQAPATAPKDTSRWNATHRTRLPHKVGMPLGSSSGGDGVAR